MDSETRRLLWVYAGRDPLTDDLRFRFRRIIEGEEVLSSRSRKAMRDECYFAAWHEYRDRQPSTSRADFIRATFRFVANTWPRTAERYLVPSESWPAYMQSLFWAQRFAPLPTTEMQLYGILKAQFQNFRHINFGWAGPNCPP